MNRFALPSGKIAILLATYNGEEFVLEQLESLRLQSNQNFMCFIHDDGSSDRTAEFVRSFCQINKEHFVWIDAPKCGGAKKNFMFLLSEVQAEYYMFCDQDDIWAADKIQMSLDAMRNCEESFDGPVCVHTDLRVVDRENNVLSDSYYTYTGKEPHADSITDLLKVNVVVGCTMMINRSLRDLALTAQDMNNIFMHDWWIALLASCEGRIVYCPTQLINYRQHGTNGIGAIKVKSIAQKLRQLIDLKRYLQTKRFRNQRMISFARELTAVIDSNNPYYVFFGTLWNNFR